MKKRTVFISILLSMAKLLVVSSAIAETQELKRLRVKRVLGTNTAVFDNNGNFLAPTNWHHKNLIEDNLLGISSNKAYQKRPKLLKGKEIIVAVIDSGVDVNHEDLKNKIWINKKEIPNNQIDDDQNGYIDDYMGWNFLGSSKGAATFKLQDGGQAVLLKGDKASQLNSDSLEITRRYKTLLNKTNTSEAEKIEKSGLEAKINIKLSRAKRLYLSYLQDIKFFTGAVNALSMYGLDPENVSVKTLKDLSIEDSNPFILKAVEYLIDNLKNNIDLVYLKEQAEMYRVQFASHYNISNANRIKIVGDNPDNIHERFYGNNDVIGSNSQHGTSVAGIIAARRENNNAMGVATNVKIMPIRAIPNGDERDKDIISAIYYAVNNGAHIINLSFGKYLSPNEKEVQAALKYAERKNVLIIQAAGNDYLNIDKSASFPNPFINGVKLSNYITVAASTPNDDDAIFSGFSNYGKRKVDILAPGSYIFTTIPNNKYSVISGTSAAAPVVSGSAAVLLSQAPNLAPIEIKRLLISGMSNYSGTMIFKPDLGRVLLNNIIQNPGVINLYNSIELLFDNNNLALYK